MVLHRVVRQQVGKTGLRTRGARSGPPRAVASGHVQHGPRGGQSFPPRHVWGKLVSRLMPALAVLLVAANAVAAPPGAPIRNEASLSYLDPAGSPASVTSNRVELVTAVLRSSASVEFTRVVAGAQNGVQEPVGPSACFDGSAYTVLPDPVVIGGTSIDPAVPQNVAGSSSFLSGETVFLRLADADQNLDFHLVEYAIVEISSVSGADIETIRLTETGPDTGVFAGYLPTVAAAPSAGDCVLQVATGGSIEVRYSDPADASDSAADVALIDPAQRVFESRTGTLVDGVTIELVDAATGLPATVYGNDGVARFPSSVVSGSQVTDSAGTVYVFSTGEYRFPVVPDGEYRLLVSPPADYAAPSTASVAELQALPGAPWSLGEASFGSPFTKSASLSVAVDIPVDPRASALFLDKRTTTGVASPGDFVRYELVVENSSTSGVATDLHIVDELPAGVRFVTGSVTLNGDSAPDPTLSPDRRTLTFELAPLEVGERTSLAYVVEILAARDSDEIVNRATAFAAGGLASNEAAAAIRLTEDLFRSTGTVIGRVLEADCSQDSFADEQGVAGIRIYLEDGRYAVTDSGGRFHFEGLEAGTHVAQLDTFSVPDWFDVIGCGDDPQFAGRADSRFVKLTPGALKRADFFLRRKEPPRGRIDLELRHLETDSAEGAAYELTLNGIGNVSISNINAMLLLPDGVTYTDGSMRVDGRELGDPTIRNGAITFALPDKSGNWQSRIRFDASIAADVAGEVATKAVATFDTPMASRQKTPIAETRMLRKPAEVRNDGYLLNLTFAVLSDELSDADRAELDALVADWRGVRDIEISAVGHSDSQPIAARNRARFADNYVLSEARARSAAAYIATALGVPASRIQVAGRGPDEPVASNATTEGRASNRRVEMILSGLRPSKPSFLAVTQETSGALETSTLGAVPGTGAKQARPWEQVDDNTGMPTSQIEAPLDSLEAGAGFVLPGPSFTPAIPATRVAVRHAPAQRVTLTVNGRPVSGLNFDKTVIRDDERVAVSRWRTVSLDDGENRLVAAIHNADGSIADRIRRSVFFAGPPIRAEVVGDASELTADGKNPPVIAVRLYDRSGRPARPGMVGAFSVDPPYRSQWDVDASRENALVAVADREPSYRIGADGIAYLVLEPTTLTGEVTVNLRFENNRRQELRAWLGPAERDWIMVGFAEGTAGYNTLSDNASLAAAAGLEDEYYDDGRVAFFAKGRIRGDLLLTLAYDSARDRDESRGRFETVVDPNAWYPLYADGSEQRYEAPSQRKLYLKLERKQFVALFGDFDSGLSVTDLARYERRFNGIKSEYRGEHVGYTAFAAESDQSFNRDELRGDGTSGLYRLSQAPIIVNSEQVTIEVRDRLDSGVVLESRKLARFLDYNIDPLDGTLYFKAPVPSRDLDFNPVYIVVEYESESVTGDDIVAGGRASIRFADDSVEIGATHINDGTSGAESDLTGVDMRWQLNEQTLISAEYAESTSVVAAAEQSGTAHSVSIEHNGEKVDVLAYVREVDEDFGLGYQAAADSGFRRLGLDGRGQIAERWFVEGEAQWQQNLDTEDIRNLARAQLRYERDSFTASLGFMHASDQFEDGDTRTSDLAEVGVSQRLFDGNLTLRLSGSTSLGTEAGSTDFPNRYVFGADYRVADGIDLVAEYEEASGRDIEATMTRVGVRATPWNRAQLTTSMTNEVTEFGPRLFANVGLVQGFTLGEHWTFDVGVDQTDTLLEPDARPLDPDRELVTGSLGDDFVAAYAGAAYSAEAWSANSRIEFRNSDAEERRSLLFGWYREPQRGHGLSAGLTLYDADTAGGASSTAADLKLGWAWRMADARWSFLDRLDLVYERSRTGSSNLDTYRIVNNFNANRRLGIATELSLQYASKYVRSNFDEEEYSGYTDLAGFDLRHGFRRRWDAGVHASMYQSWESDVVDYSAGIDLGFNVFDNAWLTLGYNFTGFYDQDFVEARYSAAGPYLRISIKADQHTLQRIAGQR